MLCFIAFSDSSGRHSSKKHVSCSVLIFVPSLVYLFFGCHIVSRLIEGDHIYSREDALVDVQHRNFSSSTALPLPLGPFMIALNSSLGTTYFDCGNPQVISSMGLISDRNFYLHKK